MIKDLKDTINENNFYIKEIEENKKKDYKLKMNQLDEILLKIN